MAATSLDEFQGARDAAIRPKNCGPEVELKMSRRLRCFSVAGRKGHAPSSRLGAGYTKTRSKNHMAFTSESGHRQAMEMERDYVLGTHDEEMARLGLQHEVWRAAVLDCWKRAGITGG